MDRTSRAIEARVLMRKLNRFFGLSGKVRLSFLKHVDRHPGFESCYGYCLAPNAAGVVRIIISDERMSKTTLFDTLIHEYAHAILYHLSPNHRAAHGAQWGRLYAAVFRVAVDEYPSDAEEE